MVTLRQGMQSIALALLISLGATGCSLKHWLGGDPPPAKIVSKEDAASQTGPSADCDSWTKIYEGSEEESASTFECWAAKEPDVWKKVHGEHPGELTEREMSLLIRDGIVSLDATAEGREMWIRRFIAIKNLLGFGTTVTRVRVDRWISWLRAHRADIRRTYAHGTPFWNTTSLQYSDLQTAATTAASFLRELEWNKSSTEIAPLIQDVFAITDKQTLGEVEPGIRVVRNLLGFICPLQSAADRMVPNEIASCFEKAGEHFKPSSHWIEFMLNEKGSVDQAQAAVVKQSIQTAATLVKDWFTQPGLKPIDTQLLYDWSKAMGAKPPENFIASLKMVKRLKTQSDEYHIYPSVMGQVFILIQDYENLVLEALPYFTNAYNHHDCKNPNAESWKDCVLKDLSVREKSPTIDMLLRVKNPRHGMDAVPVNGSVMNTVAFYNAAAGQMIQLFDDNADGVISVDIGPEGDELVNFITSSIETYQSVDHYLSNLGNRFKGRVIDALSDQNNISISQWNVVEFAKLVSSANDVLVERTEKQKDIFEEVFSHLSNNFPKSALFLDRPAITAVLTTITSLSDYREVALTEILGSDKLAKEAMNLNKPFSREIFRAHIGDMLKRNFPRTYESCNKFGFEISCLIAFDEVMPSPDDARKLVSPSDIDVVTLMAIGMEGVFDTCGLRKNGTLKSALMDGNDELDCGFNKMKEVAVRLMESGVVHVSPNTKSLAETALNTINSLFITRTIGKVALIRGSMSAPLLNMPFFWMFGDTATLGSSYALLSDIVASDRVAEVKSKAK